MHSEWYQRELARMRSERLAQEQRDRDRQRCWAKLEARERLNARLGIWCWPLRIWQAKLEILGAACFLFFVCYSTVDIVDALMNYEPPRFDCKCCVAP